MTDRRDTFERVPRLDPGRTALLVVATPWPEIQRATLDTIGRARGRVVSSKHVIDEVSAW